MTTTNDYQRHAEGLRNLATLINELERLLGPLRDELYLATSTHRIDFEVSLLAKTSGEIAGSTWHRAVLRLSDYFDEPFIVDDLGKLRATFTTPFGSKVCVWTDRRGFKPVPTAMTLAEAVA